MFAKGVPLRRASRSLPGAVPRGPASHWGRASLTAHRGRFHPGLPSCATESLCESCFSRPIRPSRSMVVRRVRGASSLVRSDPRRRARDSGARPMRRRARTSGRTPDKQTRRWPLRRSEQRFRLLLARLLVAGFLSAGCLFELAIISFPAEREISAEAMVAKGRCVTGHARSARVAHRRPR